MGGSDRGGNLYVDGMEGSDRGWNSYVGGSERGGSRYVGGSDSGGNSYVGVTGGGHRGGNKDKRGIRGNIIGGGTRNSSDKRGSEGMIPHDSSPVDGNRSGKGSHLSSAGSGIERPSNTRGLDTISDQEDSESDENTEDTGEDIVRRGSTITSTPPAHPSERVWISRLGRGFSDEFVHRQITCIMRQCVYGPWSTWRKVPKSARETMFECFRGIYQWHDSEEDSILEGFKYISSERYRDILSSARDESALAAEKAGRPEPKIRDYSVMRDFRPHWIRSEIWQALCAIWGTDIWRNKSESAKRNRNSSADGSISVHTGGSITTEQHRLKMTKATGREPPWPNVFSRTHLEKSAKLKLASGELIGSQPEHWVNKKSWKIFNNYEKAMSEKYGPDPTQHPLGDVEMWDHCSGGRKKGRVYGVGSSDPSYVVSGTAYKSVSPSEDYALAQKRISELESMLEKEAKEREELQARIDHEVKMREEMETRLQAQMLEIVKKFTQSGKQAESS